jgi:hypothetical protein
VLRPIFRSEIFWNAWILYKLDFFADPQSCIPYVHIRFRRDLNISGLVFSIVSLFFESNIFKDRD